MTGGYAVESAEFNMRYLADSDQVEFIVTMNSNSWFGLVLGQRNMSRDGDMLVFFANGETDSSYADYHSVGFMAPEQDFLQDLEPHPDNSVEMDEDGRVSLFARRSLDTEDTDQDYVIPLDEEFYIGYALND